MDLLVVVVLLLAVVLAAAGARLTRPATRAPEFVAKRFLSEAETRVLGLLEAALPGHRIMAQVAMGALLAAGERDRARATATRNRFSGKIVDFAVVTRDSTEVVALIELDDRTHNPAKDMQRDAMTAAAGYRTIRIPGRPRPTAHSIREAVAELVLDRPPATPPVHGRSAVPA